MKRAALQRCLLMASESLGESWADGTTSLMCGVDHVDVSVFRHDLDVGGTQFLERIFTKAELDYCAGRVERLAVRFAAKEAVLKALGTGLRGIGWHEVEICSETNGQPLVLLHGRAAIAAQSQGVRSWCVSLSHSDGLAIALIAGLKSSQKSGFVGRVKAVGGDA
jgi:holo-[acyl-carrier protein] synthase